MQIIKLIIITTLFLTLTSCSEGDNSRGDQMDKPEKEPEKQSVIEVTTFKYKPDVDADAFWKRDAEIQEDFTAKQKGFINRASGSSDDGEIAVIVYWETLSDAEASMNKFMGDDLVRDYAQMIDAPTMKMTRYTIDKPFNAKKGQFVEIMSFDVKPGTDLAKFDALNQKVETDFTGKREGFIQRLTGVNEKGRQIVVIYWANKELSDASLKPFMEAPIAKEFMEAMDQPSMTMGRYKLQTK